jgi:CheY-like chemotaxis protein
MAKVQQQRFLVLRGSHTRTDSSLIEQLEQCGEVRRVDDLDAALAALKDDIFDLVISEAADFLPLERAMASGQANVILETIGQGVCIVDLSGSLLWANPRMLAYPEELLKQVCARCIEQAATVMHEPIDASSHHRAKRFSLTISGDQYFEVTATPVTNPEGQLTQVAAVVWDNTSAHRLQKQLDAIDRAGRETVRLDAEQTAKLDAHERLELLEEKIIRYTRELMHFDNFAIRLRDPKTNRLELVLCTGLPTKAQNIDIFASAEGNGISGYVASKGRSYICPDVKTDRRYLVGIDNACSSLTVPLRLHDHVIGVLNVESDTPAFFTEDDRQVAEIFGRYVAISLHILDLLNVERHTTTGQLADSVTAEISGPLNDIMSESLTLMEEYIGHDDLRHRLQAIADNAGKIKHTIKEVGRPGEGVHGRRPQGPQPDALLAEKRLLVADDEEAIRETVSDVLTKYGCVIETARNGEEAMAMIQRCGGDPSAAYDLVLSDIRMPGKSGYEVFAAVKDVDADCPVILMTGFGYDPSHSIIRARREGLAAVLFKPFKVDQLLSEIRRAISR